jgi:TRAP-type C4-dicarboxylate transport system permease small subunit
VLKKVSSGTRAALWMTAPVLSLGFAGLVLLIGWVRWRTRAARDISTVLEKGAM